MAGRKSTLFLQKKSIRKQVYLGFFQNLEKQLVGRHLTSPVKERENEFQFFLLEFLLFFCIDCFNTILAIKISILSTIFFYLNEGINFLSSNVKLCFICNPSNELMGFEKSNVCRFFTILCELRILCIWF